MSKKNKTTVTAEPGKLELFITREFEAPRDLVFKAFEDPAILMRFLGPDDLEMQIDYYDSRTGGSYRYIHSDNKGNTYSFHGSIHEVLAPERIIQTFEYEGLPEKGHVNLDFLQFEALPNNRTRLLIHSVYRSVSDRDGMIRSGMERGVSQGFNRLDVLLEKGF